MRGRITRKARRELQRIYAEGKRRILRAHRAEEVAGASRWVDNAERRARNRGRRK